MDPNTALADLRELAADVRAAQPLVDTARAAADRAAEGDSNDDEIDQLNELIAALDAGYRFGYNLAERLVAFDEWLRVGGHSPEEWRPAPGPRPADHATLGGFTVSELVGSALRETLGLADHFRDSGIDDHLANAYLGSIGSRLAVAQGKL